MSAEACKAAADALGITYNTESMNGKWTHTPPGCFVHKGCTQGCRLHFGTGNGNNNGHFRAICDVAQAPTPQATYDFVEGANCGQGLKVASAEACKAAADALGIAYNKESINGKWTHTPPGCFVHKDCTQGCRLHFGNGNAQALTTEAPTTEAPITEAPTTEALTTEVPAQWHPPRRHRQRRYLHRRHPQQRHPQRRPVQWSPAFALNKHQAGPSSFRDVVRTSIFATPGRKICTDTAHKHVVSIRRATLQLAMLAADLEAASTQIRLW